MLALESLIPVRDVVRYIREKKTRIRVDVFDHSRMNASKRDDRQWQSAIGCSTGQLYLSGNLELPRRQRSLLNVFGATAGVRVAGGDGISLTRTRSL